MKDTASSTNESPEMHRPPVAKPTVAQKGFPSIGMRWQLTLSLILFGTMMTGHLSTVTVTTTRARMRVDFSHSICPECVKRHYPNIDIS